MNYILNLFINKQYIGILNNVYYLIYLQIQCEFEVYLFLEIFQKNFRNFFLSIKILEISKEEGKFLDEIVIFIISKYL